MKRFSNTFTGRKVKKKKRIVVWGYLHPDHQKWLGPMTDNKILAEQGEYLAQEILSAFNLRLLMTAKTQIQEEE